MDKEMAVVQQMAKKLLSSRGGKVPILPHEIKTLCVEANKSFLAQPSLLRLQGPIKICGDIHGQFKDLLNLFKTGGKPGRARYLFLGDYVDRGRNSLETICLLLSLKVLYPDSVHLVRGNHEIKRMNHSYGFFSEVKRRFKSRKESTLLYDKINRTFDHIPIAAVVADRIFCCHGGIGPGLRTLDQIERFRRPMGIKKGWVTDVLWSDPDEDITWWERQNQPETNPKHRGTGYLFGKLALEEFLDKNGLDFICRAHECMEKGYKWYFEKQLVTVFSAPSYCGNPGAMLKITGDGRVAGFLRFR